ncbi:MAG: TfuA-related McrA-glycine thioamidation protein [Methanocorpusculum sp.]|nr:TfuA-related McrA-glycine thioamidation protein [Methanocorpusculum sp.]MDE2523252.1 TfuA-related McrA-glycine thioamidation protein [Methanocorpusculum sp.]MDE2525229.1 TfuA-related McrA-glycine thioamidation protein [Methanocorpusculum sp.]
MPNAVVFIGPSLPLDEAKQILPDAEYLPPAKRGDLTDAVRAGAKTIVLIDGVFFQDRAVGHREILAALRAGVSVYGSSSMGALRASEMDTLGMIGIGEVYRWYHDGTIIADDEVGLVYDPETHTALSEPMVNIRATLAKARDAGIIDDTGEKELLRACKAIYYPDRTYRRVIRDAEISAEQKSSLTTWIKTNAVDQKRLDAVTCLTAVRETLA